MVEIFGVRSLIYWWGVLTATVFLKDWLKQLAVLLTSPDVFLPTKMPFNTLPGLNAIIDGISKYTTDAIKFNPNQILAAVGPLNIPGWTLAIILGLVLLGIGIRAYIRALKSDPWYDDFITLFLLYVIIRFEGHILGATTLPMSDQFRQLIVNQALSYFIIMGLLFGLSFAGAGLKSKRAFWRAFGAAQIVSMFIYPHETAFVLGYAISALAVFGETLMMPQNLPFAVLWGLIGMLFALQRLIMQEAPAGGGGGHGEGGHGGGGKPKGEGKPRAEGKPAG